MTLQTETPRLAPAARPARRAAAVDRPALERDLRRSVRGEVRFDAGSRALYSTDASNYRQVPIGVVLPRSADDVEAAVAACREHGAPLLSRGGGTSLAGQCCNVAVVLDFSKYMNRIVDVDVDRRRARVQPGLVLDHLRSATERRGLTYGPDPATHNHCTFGGMIGNNSCGIHSVMAGRTEDNVHELEVLTYDGLRLRVGPTSDDELEQIVRAGGRRGEIYRRLRELRDRTADLVRARYPDIPRRVSGYNLPALLPENGFHVARALVGTESTCVTVLEATVRLVDNPSARTLVVLGYEDVYAAGDQVPRVMEHGPIGLEGIDDRLIEDMKRKHMHPRDLKLLPEGKGWLLVEFGGASRDEADAKARRLMLALEGKGPVDMKLFDDPDEEHKVWEVRESGLGATARVPDRPDAWPGWEDSAVPPERVGGYLRELRQLLDRFGYQGALYGHFGQGCIHIRIDFDLKTPLGRRTYRRFIEEAADLVVSFGGSLSGEHGDGQARGALLPKMYGEELVHAFEEFKSIWDPAWKMNPGKVVDADSPLAHLRLEAGYEEVKPPTGFAYPNDDGNFGRATMRCVGVGKCRKTESGVMCPSYQVTGEEMHSTRGRARLLAEMLVGDPLEGGWQDEHVHEALDLCLACKGCKSECPMDVDMATYKAEFLSHYYQRHRRPRVAYAFGWIDRWARLASHVPRLVNLAAATPGVRALAKRAAGMAPERRIPRFATRTFKSWFAARPPSPRGRERVLLWPDTFNNYLTPAPARDAVAVLEAAGYEVAVPQPHLCCGRPLYDYGMLDLARGYLRRILDELRPELRAGTRIVGLEPSCVAVFRDEMVEMLPHDDDAKRAKEQTLLLSELLAERDGRTPWRGALDRHALVHHHCHQHAVLDAGKQDQVLRATGLEIEVLDSGCCGMAGSFGFEAGERYEVSIRCGERVLLPKVTAAADDTLIVADGYSCREQISQCTDREALHTAQVLRMALDGKG